MKQELRSTLNQERELYIPHIQSLKNRIMAKYTHNEEYEIYRFIVALRKAEFHQNNKLLFAYYYRKSNILGERLGYFIAPGVLGKKARIYHRGDIIINSQSKIGEGCIFHGDNCVGNNGIDNNCPVLGKRVELGIGAKVIGGVTLADDVKIGANAVVTKSFTEPGITIAGVPAKIIKG